ncbi:hypothetical protein MA16_Dca022491 [Dendrobium catenatum]|uniref:Uncharacterized protein n=1 Tax=Dendrobium catenatum TaxID=906689 RepID=A0A2I0XFY8_9ASPA|nr:hypothetical protein MA16_Dca022491 [Dendrobium catenatum]
MPKATLVNVHNIPSFFFHKFPKAILKTAQAISEKQPSINSFSEIIGNSRHQRAKFSESKQPARIQSSKGIQSIEFSPQLIQATVFQETRRKGKGKGQGHSKSKLHNEVPFFGI